MDGAPLRPPVPSTTFTPPGTGLPEYWGPPEVKPDVQPNPRPKRVLPPSREPGIWASEEPPGWNDPLPTIKVLEVEIPMPEEVKTRWDGELAVRCAFIMDMGLRTNHALVVNIGKLGRDQQRCVAAAAFSYCVHSLGEKYRALLNEREQNTALSPGEQLARYRIDSVQRGATGAVEKECDKAPPDVAGIFVPLFEAVLRSTSPRVLQ